MISSIYRLRCFVERSTISYSYLKAHFMTYLQTEKTNLYSHKDYSATRAVFFCNSPSQGQNVCNLADKETARGTNFMFIHVFTVATLYYMLSTLFYVNFSFYGLNSNKGYKSVRKPSRLPISLPTKWSRQATLHIQSQNNFHTCLWHAYHRHLFLLCSSQP